MYKLKCVFALCSMLLLFGLQAQVYNMGNLGDIHTCSGTFYDSGGPMNPYAKPEYSLLTFYSNSDSAIYLHFEYMYVYPTDTMYVFNGTDTLAPLLETYTGGYMNDVVSDNPNNCLTVLFKSPPFLLSTSGNMGWKAQVGCFSGNTPTAGCIAARQFCAENSYSVPADTQALAEPGPHYGCLNTQPNPTWFYLRIDEPGNLDIKVSNTEGEDVDFVCWGPFADRDACGLLTSNKLVDCSYDATAVERIEIDNAQHGDYYIICLTNYSQGGTMLELNTDETTTTATTFCVLDTISPIIDTPSCYFSSVTALASGCQEDGSYTIDGKIILANAPTTGTLNIVTEQGQQVVIAAPFIGTITYTIPGIPQNIDSAFVSYYFSADANCNTLRFVTDIKADVLLNATAQPYNGDSIGTGTASAEVTGSASPYTYLWNTGDTTAVVTGLLPGTYSVTATNERGCTAVSEVEVGFEGMALMMQLITTPASASNTADGSAEAVVNGGIPPYTYLWSNQAGTATISNLLPGVYSVTVTDMRGIALNDTVAVTFTVSISDAKGGFIFSVMPNPATTQLRFQFANAIQGEGYLYSTDGRLHETFIVNKQIETLDITKLPAGIYIIQVKDRSTNTSTFTRLMKY